MRLMCDMTVDIGKVAGAHGDTPERFTPELHALETMRRDGLVDIAGTTIAMTAGRRPLVRAAAAVFDRYLDRKSGGSPRHARAV